MRLLPVIEAAYPNQAVARTSSATAWVTKFPGGPISVDAAGPVDADGPSGVTVVDDVGAPVSEDGVGDPDPPEMGFTGSVITGVAESETDVLGGAATALLRELPTA